MVKIPAHIAIIMDGNGRWALAKGLPRLDGHRAGAETVRRVLQYCQQAGVKYLTLYAFSSENWSRPKEECDGLMGLFSTFLKQEEQHLHDNRVRLRVIGCREDLPEELRHQIDQVESRTKAYTHQLILAVSYGGRAEITQAARRLAQRVAEGKLSPEEIGEDDLRGAFYAPDIPDPDLIIRTSGEFRLSNFLLWQAAYAEFFMTQCNWPDFGEDEFKQALAAYAQRDRRFGNHA